MGKPWHHAGGIFCKQLLCCPPGNGAGEICHGKHTVREAGAHSKAHGGHSPVGTAEGGSKPYSGRYHGQGAGGTPAGPGGRFHTRRPFREEFQFCGSKREGILPGECKDEPGGDPGKDHGACPWHGKTAGYYAGTDPLPDGR